ncbi:hypothetical protein CRYO30217_00522 [Parvicella tangerina]|uniref:Carboxypeptidase regulatory-like domain-containing protein n=2 Tax=Parvicella tangerina TaxID=2829795 RepID=A0A916NFI6_9FLAO|nr:hypothetical protein CRYO30217_00522 [Parvicella tangerina]
MSIKKSLFLLLLFVALGFQSKSPEYVPPFKIISDTIDKSVPADKCLVTGVVTYNEKTVNEATVKAYDYDEASGYTQMTLLVNSDKLGRIRMSVDSSTFFLTAWKPGTGTAYIEGVKFKGGHHIVMEIYLPDEEMEVVEKPVVYLYNNKEPLDASVQVDTDMEMIFSYPQLNKNNSWNVNVNAEGIRTENGSKYPYLFWEAETKGYEFYTRREGLILGQIIKTDTAVPYLENKLTSLHLNSTEITDFITYWGPRLQQMEYALIQFKTDEEVDDIAHLNITPQPDWIRRVYMVFTGFEKEPALKVLDVSPMEEGLVKREGFHVVEWGGSEISRINL